MSGTNGIIAGIGDFGISQLADEANDAKDLAVLAKDTAVSAKDTAVSKASEASVSATNASNSATSAQESEQLAAQHLSEIYEVGFQSEYNPNTNTPTLSPTPNPALDNSAWYLIAVPGTLSFATSNYPSGQSVVVGDKLRKKGGQWVLDRFEIADNSVTTKKANFIQSIFDASNFSTLFSNAWIAANGNRVDVNTSYVSRKMPVVAGEKYLVSVNLPVVLSGGNPIVRRAYAFYSSFTTIDNTTLLGGATETGATINVFEEITIPVNCTCLAFSDAVVSSVKIGRIDAIRNYLLSKSSLVQTLGFSQDSIVSQVEITNKLFSIFDAANFTSFFSNGWIGSDGNKVNVTIDYTCRKMPVVAGEKYLISQVLPAVGGTPIIRLPYAFYSSFTTTDNTTLLGGAAQTSASLNIFEEITIPANCTCLAFSDSVVSAVKIMSLNKVVTSVAQGVAANNYIEGIIKSQSASSYFGVLGNGQGITSDEAKAFQGLWMNYDGNVRTYYINYVAGGKGTITFRNTLNNTVIGILYCDFAQSSYSLHAIYTATNTTGNNEPVGYCLLNPSILARSTVGTFWVTFNNSISAYNNFIAGKNIQRILEIIGDSLTALGSGYGNFLTVAGFVTNAHGVGSENPKHILGRLGAFPYLINADFTIPADTTPVSLSLVSSFDLNALYPYNTFGMNPVTIRGVKGTITVTTPNSAATFTRLSAGTAVSVKKSEPIITYLSKIFPNTFLILWMGQNGYANADELVAQYEVVARLKGDSNFLFLTPHLNTSTELETKMRQRFSRNFVNMRDWSVKYGLEESGITPTTADLDAIALGNCPPSLLSDGTHYVTSARQAIANMLYRKVLETYA